MKSNMILVIIAATSILTILTQILPPIQQEAVAQNTTTANQTQGGEATASIWLANLTEADFESVTDNLNAAREALQANDTTEAYNAVNSIESGLFEIAETVKLTQLLQPLQDSVDNARDALRDSDTADVVQQLNSTDVELLKIIEQLSTEEEEEEEEEE